MIAESLARYSGMSILIVDDNETNVALLRYLLEKQGLTRIYEETDSRRVAGRLPDLRPDLVLLDLHMPHLDGHQVLTQIQRFAAGTYLPVLVLTADTTVDARNRALAQGAQDYLTKPLDTVEATLRIANLLETRMLYLTLRPVGEVQASEDGSSPGHRATHARITDVLTEQAVDLVYQPVVDILSMTPVGCEGLSRFRDGALQGPDRWFADAFSVGLGVELEWLAAKTALRALDEKPSDMFVAVNMSPASILRMKDEELCDHELAERVVIELTEHVPVEDYTAVHVALAEMRSSGARLAADDLGAGYAGFRHLISLKPDIIKLDISLTGGIDRSPAQRALAKALVAFATDMGAQVVAEGVENAGELDALRSLGVPWAQGFYLGRPGPLRCGDAAHGQRPAAIR